MISVGNLSLGGTGKTPLVLQLAEWLVGQGERPAILTRGYGRRERCDGVVVVSDGGMHGGGPVRCGQLANLDRAGDEPLMLARAVPRAIIAVADERYLAGVLAEHRLGATVHLLDDGFQHFALARDFDILMTRPGEISEGRTLPFGRLRESPDAARRADFVVVLDSDATTARSEAWTLGVSAASAARRVLSTSRADAMEGGTSAFAGASAVAKATADHRSFSGGWSADRHSHGGGWSVPPTGAAKATPSMEGVAGTVGATGAVVAVAGIAHPEQFFSMVREAGYDVANTVAFPDHHPYTATDIRRLAAVVQSARSQVVVTTEKDAVRLEAAVRLDAAGALPFTFVPVRMRLEVEEWNGLCASVTSAIERARQTRPSVHGPGPRPGAQVQYSFRRP